MKRRNPRHGSMQFWPRVKAKSQTPRIRSWKTDESGLLGFIGYKAGMTHVIAVDSGKNSPTKGEKIQVPVTVVECPPMKIASVRLYVPHGYGFKVQQELFFKTDKDYLKRGVASKNIIGVKDLDSLDLTNVTQVMLSVYSQPKLLGFGKKIPDILEMAVGGSNEDAINFIKDHLEKGISVSEILKEGSFVDARAVTTGKGTQGPVKRFGVSLRNHKSEKTIRGPGSLGGWKGQGHFMYRIAFAGQTGYHQRTQYSNMVLGVFNDPAKVNPKGGFINYGFVKGDYILVKGSVPGPKKRLIALTQPLRKVKNASLPTINFISTDSKQGC